MVHFTEILRQEIRLGDIPGRLGDEEFALWLPDASLADAMHVAERIRVTLEPMTGRPIGERYWMLYRTVVVEGEAAVVTSVEYEVNENVRVTSGPFADFTGTISEINADASKLKVGF